MPKRDFEKFKLIEKFIDDYKEEHNTSPSIREIGAAVGLSKSSVANYLSDMRDRGILDYSGFRNITTGKERKFNEDSVRVSVLSDTCDSISILSEENIMEYVRLPASLYGKDDYFIVRADGQSMAGDGIDDGDLILIKKQDNAESGQLVFAIDDGNVTIKRYFPELENSRIRLHSDDKGSDNIYVAECTILGIPKYVIRKELK